MQMSKNGRVEGGIIAGNFGRKFIGPEKAGELIAQRAMNAVQAALDRTLIEVIQEYLKETGQNPSFVEVAGDFWTVTNDGGPIFLSLSGNCEQLHKKNPIALATEMGLSIVTEGPDYDRIVAAVKDSEKAMEDEEESF